MGRLTTHVLDTSHGRPAAGMALTLFRIENGSDVYIKNLRTNDDGRCDEPLLEGADLVPGPYQITFEVSDYFAGLGVASAGAFLDTVPLRFVITDNEAHYHVPLLVSPYSYSTYRGS